MTRCSALQHLGLANTGISDAGLEALAASWSERRTLKELQICSNSLTRMGIRRLATLVGTCSLTTLSLGDNAQKAWEPNNGQPGFLPLHPPLHTSTGAK